MAERMNWNVRTFPLVALAITLAAALPGCGKDQQDEVDRCAGVACAEGLTCDTGDGVCKCGGTGGVICGGSGLCKEGVCAYSCGQTTCDRGLTLDVFDCTCKCGGQGGPVCTQTEQCEPSTRSCYVPSRCDGVACEAGMQCDAADGLCKCRGVECADGESCLAGACAADLCAGVHCTGGTDCNPEDGRCHCGGNAGQICSLGELCECPGGAPACVQAEERCTLSTRCINVQCSGGTTCDPENGECRCGGPGGPVCAFGQSCDVIAQACLGGDRCAGVSCTGGLNCDPEDGICKCGGLNGEVCLENQACALLADGNAVCVTPCDPRQQGCNLGEACYFDIFAQISFCDAVGLKTEGMGCFKASECALGFHCQQEPFQPGVCRRYCNVPDGADGCPQNLEPQACQSLDGAAEGIGACDAS